MMHSTNVPLDFESVPQIILSPKNPVNMPPKIRRATHSGSWYPSAKTQLQNLLDSYND